MELRHLRYLVAVAEEHSFLKASIRLRVAQSALSKQIQDLEREIGVKLFHRVPRGVIPTLAGIEFLREARATLANAERAVLRARHVQEEANHVLRVGHGPLLARAPVVLDLLTEFRKAYPQAEVDIHHLDEEQQRSALLEHTIDFAVAYLAGPVESVFQSLPLIDCSCEGALLPSDHPLARQERIQVRDLKDLSLLVPSSVRWPRVYRTMLDGLAERGLVVTRTRTLSADAHTGIMEVAAGGAWVLANEANATLYREMAPAITYRPFVEPPIPIHLALMWLQDPVSRWITPVLEIARKRSEVGRVA